eukprot:scaffold294716_cov26-Tisochrysis_lutea.AAC.1
MQTSALAPGLTLAGHHTSCLRWMVSDHWSGTLGSDQAFNCGLQPCEPQSMCGGHEIQTP